jgi:hypothetical protein
MGSYAALSDVRGRLPGRTISATSKPSQTDVDTWITEGEALLDGVLASIGLSVPVTSPARAVIILKAWTLLYAEGHTRMAFASAGGDGANADGKDLVEQFEAKINWILAHPNDALSQLASGDAPDSARRMRGYVLDNRDGKTVSNGDFAPTFTKADAEDQL